MAVPVQDLAGKKKALLEAWETQDDIFFTLEKTTMLPVFFRKSYWLDIFQNYDCTDEDLDRMNLEYQSDFRYYVVKGLLEVNGLCYDTIRQLVMPDGVFQKGYYTKRMYDMPKEYQDLDYEKIHADFLYFIPDTVEIDIYDLNKTFYNLLDFINTVNYTDFFRIYLSHRDILCRKKYSIKKQLADCYIHNVTYRAKNTTYTKHPTLPNPNP